MATSSKNKDQTDQEDATIGSGGTDDKIEDEDMEQPEEVEEYHNDDAQINQCESKIKASYMETK